MITTDYSTINEKALKALCPVYTKPPSYQISDSMGSGCAGDPPGYPSYFIRSVYTAYGNHPSRGTTEVIDYRGRFYAVPDFWKSAKNWDEYTLARKQFYSKIWLPLPEDHPRVQAWIADLYRHMKHCYHDPNEPAHTGQTLIFPVPDYKLRKFHDDFRWNDEYREALKAEIEAHNAMIIKYATMLATPDNHKAVRSIRRTYPNHAPRLDYIEKPISTIANWWEVLSEKPEPDQCPGMTTRWSRSAGYNTKHPLNGKWCQVCGWVSDEVITDRLIKAQHSRNTKISPE